MGSLNIVRAAAPPTFPAIYLAILMSLNPLHCELLNTPQWPKKLMIGKLQQHSNYYY
jgi:hypothetical protein